jgi:hypothetical protein
MIAHSNLLARIMSILKLSNTDIKLSADLIYPVGSIYMSVNDTNPSKLFGGTWEQIKDKFLLSCGDTYTNGSTGGEATHTLTVDEMPSHKHNPLHVITNVDSSASATGFGVSWTTNAGTQSMTDTGNEGGSKAHNNMPPYLAVYVWKRTK